MATRIGKETFEQIAKYYAEKLSATNKADYTYNYDGGVQAGVEYCLNAVYGYEYDSKNDKDVSLSVRVKERAAELVEDWDLDDKRLNGEYTLGGQRVKVERSWNPDFRELLYWSGNGYSYVGSQTIKNETVLDLVYNNLLVKYVASALDELYEVPEQLTDVKAEV